MFYYYYMENSEKASRVTRARVGVKYAPYRWATLAAIFCSEVAHKLEFIPGKHLLPEPFNYFDHVGNASASGVAAFISTGIAAKILSSRESQNPGQVSKLAFAIGMTAVTAANVISETQMGASFDSADLAYGIAVGALTASVVGVTEAGSPPKQ